MKSHPSPLPSTQNSPKYHATKANSMYLIKILMLSSAYREKLFGMWWYPFLSWGEQEGWYWSQYVPNPFKNGML